MSNASWIFLVALAGTASAAESCDKTCLESIGDQYRAAYVKHDPSLAPFAKTPRFSENNVEMRFPDGSWDTVTREPGPALTVSDPSTGNLGIYTTVMQNDTPGYLAIRLQIKNGKITEIEHILSTKRNLSGPPTPIGEVSEFKHEPDLVKTVPPAERSSRKEMIALANGYFETLQHNNGEIRGTRFSPDASRSENGKSFSEIEKGFKTGFYAFNNRVRDRDFFLVDEERGLVMSRMFIDHKGVLDTYKLTDGEEKHSVFREPHTWSALEMFKIKNGMITGVEATFIGAPYYIRSPYTKHPDPR